MPLSTFPLHRSPSTEADFQAVEIALSDYPESSCAEIGAIVGLEKQRVRRIMMTLEQEGTVESFEKVIQKQRKGRTNPVKHKVAAYYLVDS